MGGKGRCDLNLTLPPKAAFYFKIAIKNILVSTMVATASELELAKFKDPLVWST